MARLKWEDCLQTYTDGACNLKKEKGEQKKSCQEALACLNKGYDKPLTSNLFDAFGDSMKETAGVATVLSIIGILIFK